MKILFFSDLHGSRRQARLLLAAIDREKPSLIAGLGDYLYHGPRNSLPEGYSGALAAELLNSLTQDITACRGNCDSEADQTMLNFSMLNDYTTVFADGKRFFITHGHIYSEEAPPPCDIFVQGHTHIAQISTRGGRAFFNPGSAALPRGSLGPSYGLYADGLLEVKTLDGKTALRQELLL